MNAHPLGEVFILNRGLREIAPDVLDQDGNLKVMPASYYAGTQREQRSIFGVTHAAYCLPTTELIDWVRNRIGDRRAVEIGSGNGVLARALGIEGSDNWMQTWPEIALHYQEMQQPVIKYGDNVRKMDAITFARLKKPQVIVAAWVTQIYDLANPGAGGNPYGVREQELLKYCEEYIFIGNRKVHGNKPIWRLPHEVIEPPWLYSRAINGSPEFIACWKGSRSA